MSDLFKRSGAFQTVEEMATSELNHLGFRRFRPHSSLCLWVQCYWVVRKDLVYAGSTENLYPDGGVSLTFDLLQSDDRAVQVSTTQQLLQQHFSGVINQVGIRFNPGGGFALLGLPVGQLEQASYNAGQLVSSDLGSLHESLVLSLSTSVRVVLLEAWLMQQAVKLCPQPGLVQALTPGLSNPLKPYNELIDGVGSSRRKIERQFRHEVGLAPNQLKTLQRVKLARELITNRPEKSLVSISQLCGFYDQAHFIRTFRQVTQQTPGAYRKRKLSAAANIQ
jgi:AraC-like DNA-binding protein